MNLQENIHRIKQMMGVITEDKVSLIKNMINDIGLYNTIKMMGGFDNSMDEHISKEDKIKFIKETIAKLCERYDDTEVNSFNVVSNQIVYDETDDETQVIEYYSPDYITVERYAKEEEDVEYDYDDFYLGSFDVPYEELTHSLITKIFYAIIEQI